MVPEGARGKMIMAPAARQTGSGGSGLDLGFGKPHVPHAACGNRAPRCPSATARRSSGLRQRAAGRTAVAGLRPKQALQAQRVSDDVIVP